MTVIFSTGYTLPVGDKPLKHARIAHSRNWLAGGTAVASTTAAAYSVNAPLNSLTYERWKPTAVPATWEYNHGGAATADYAAVAGHTMAGCTIRFERWTGAAWAALTPDTVLADNSPILAIFSPVSGQRWRLNVLSGPIPTVAVVRFGAALQMERPFFGGHTPIDFGRQTVLRSNQSETGQYLGRTKQRTVLTTSYSWQHLSEAWVNANWKTLQLAIEAEPFWIAWRPLQSGQVGYCQTDAVPPAQYMGIQALMSAEISVRGLAYD